MVEQASVARFPPLLGGSGGASGAIIPKQLEHIQIYVLKYILRYNREVVFFFAVALRKLYGNCSIALLWPARFVSLSRASSPHYGAKAEIERISLLHNE